MASRYRSLKTASSCRVLKTALTDSDIVFGCKRFKVLGVGASRVRAQDFWDEPLAYDNPEWI